MQHRRGAANHEHDKAEFSVLRPRVERRRAALALP